MAPDGHIWFHPLGRLFREDFCRASLDMQGLFIHEMTHVAQSQLGGRYYLPLIRHPFCRYDYTIRPGQAFGRYGIEQQAEIVRHAFLLRRGMSLPDKPPLDVYRSEEHTSELQSLMRISYAVFCLKKKKLPISQYLNITIHSYDHTHITYN